MTLLDTPPSTPDTQEGNSKKWWWLPAGISAFAMVIMMAPILVILATTGSDTNCGQPVPDAGGGSLMGIKPGSLAVPMAEGTYTISSPFGMRETGMHDGQDYAAPLDTPFYAAGDGEVIAAEPAAGYGHWIRIRHTIEGQIVESLYGHMQASGVLVHTGDKVTAGQLIGKVGSEGQSSGPHLHFGIYPGGWSLGGGVDPIAWLTQHGTISPTRGPAELVAHTDSTGGDLPPLPADEGSEAHMQIDSIRVMRTIAAAFPEITTIGGWRPTGDVAQDHPDGRAVDIMIPDSASAQGKALGDKIALYLQQNKVALNVEYLIWQQRYWDGTGHWSLMEDRHGYTAHRFDHVHVTTVGGGMPTADTHYRPVPGATTTTGPCPTEVGDQTELAPGSIPPQYTNAVSAAGSLCPEVSPVLVAGIVQQESGFNDNAVSKGDGVNQGGAEGLSQFMPDTWKAFGTDSGLDRAGNAEPPNAADPFNPYDAIASEGHYLCHIADYLRPHHDSGAVTGAVTDLIIAAYNGGEGAVVTYGGIPPFGQTQAYVPAVREHMDHFAARYP